MASWNDVCLSCKHSWIEVYPDGDELKCHLECLTKGADDMNKKNTQKENNTATY